jgi:hypothetical protein
MQSKTISSSSGGDDPGANGPADVAASPKAL